MVISSLQLMQFLLMTLVIWIAVKLRRLFAIVSALDNPNRELAGGPTAMEGGS